MKKTSHLLLLFIILSGLLSCHKNNPVAHYVKKQRVQTAVDQVYKDLSDSLGVVVPSLNVLIQTPTDKIFVSSAGTAGQPITPNTYYRFASVTKNFTSAAILNMYEDGWLDYKAKITDNIPGSDIPYTPATSDWDFPYKDQITIEQLLQHSAGVFDVDNDTTIQGYDGLSYTEYVQKKDPTHQFTTGEMVKVLKDKNLSYFPPGTDHQYSNTGYSILSEIIKRVYTVKSGKKVTYASYMADYVTGNGAPVPLSTVHFPVYATDMSMPDPYVQGTILYQDRTEHYGDFNMSAQVGEGNAYGTMEDLNKYIRTLMKGQNVLTAPTVQLMQTDLSPGDTSYALGCTFTKNLGFGHNGARIGYLNVMAYDPEYDISVVSMIPLWDLRNGNASFSKCIGAIYNAAFAARRALGYPG